MMKNKERYLFTCVIRSPKRRIVSVIGGDHNEIFWLHRSRETAEPLIEFQQDIRVASHVAAMSVEHVEIDKICEDQTVWRLRPKLSDFLHAFTIRLGRMRFGDSLAGKNVADFSNSNDRSSSFIDGVQNCARRFH